MVGTDIRTGDTLMSPTVRKESTVLHVRTSNEHLIATLANGSEVEIPNTAKVRVFRSTRTINHDTPAVVFSSATA